MAAYVNTNPLQQIAAVIYTATTRTSGFLHTKHQRLSDTFNAIDQNFLLIHDASVQPFHAPSDCDALSTAWSLINKDSIAFCESVEPKAGIEISADRRSLTVEKLLVRVKVEVPPFTIEGTIHLQPGTDLLQHIHDPHRQFIPITAVQVTNVPDSSADLTMPFVLVNRNRISMLSDASQIGREAPTDIDIEPQTKVETDVNGAQAASLLAATTIFKVVPFAELEKLCQELCRQRRISRTRVGAGVTVFLQGDIGDSMYVVEDGTMEVLLEGSLIESERLLSMLHSGDIFGEMAVLGAGLRTATVRSTKPSTLLVIQQEAIEALLQAFPAASTRLITLILARRGGPEGDIYKETN